MNTMDTKKSEPEDSEKPTRIVNCARCKNHKETILLKNHKRYCKYQKCTCEKCTKTLIRQKQMAKKTRQQRARKQDEFKKIKGKLPGEIDPVSSNTKDVPETEEPLEPLEKKRRNDNLSILLGYIMREMYHFRIAWPLMSLVSTIVKYSHEYTSEADIADAISRISRVSITRHVKIILRTIVCNVILLFLLNLFPP